MRGSRSEAPESNENRKEDPSTGRWRDEQTEPGWWWWGQEAAVPSESQELLVFIMRCD